jgi:hypothetical protein
VTRAGSADLARVRADQWRRRREPHVAPLQEFADRLAAARGLPPGAVPYANPDGGGIGARVLLLLNDPGPKAVVNGGGSGMLTIDNDDPTSRQQRKAVRETGLRLATAVHWNGIPWPVAASSRSGQVRHGAVALAELLELLPDLRGMVTLGRFARQVWAQTRSSGRWGHLAHAAGPHPIASVPGVELVAAYRRAVEFARMP